MIATKITAGFLLRNRQPPIERIRKNISGEIVAFDGKTHRGAGDGIDSALHMLNAWAVKNRLMLGQLQVSDKSNEIPAMPQLMDMAFDEDRSRARTRNAAKNLGLMRGITMNLLKVNSDKGRLKGKMYRASMKLNYLKRLLRI